MTAKTETLRDDRYQDPQWYRYSSVSGEHSGSRSCRAAPAHQGHRWPTKELVEDRSQGVQLAMLKEFVRYWVMEDDWRKVRDEAGRRPAVRDEDRRRGHRISSISGRGTRM